MKRPELRASATGRERLRDGAAGVLREQDDRFRAYALAAGAAGVGLLALAQPARAEIVYTPTNITLTNGTLPIDLDGDSMTDFALAERFRRSDLCCTVYSHRSLVIGGDAGAGVIAENAAAAVLTQGSIVGPVRSFTPVQDPKLPLLTANFISSTDGIHFFFVTGNWNNVQDRFLGLKFGINGEVHYGWARLSVHAQRVGLKITTTLLGYAYETTPQLAIRAGATGGGGNASKLRPESLGALAQGWVARKIVQRGIRHGDVGLPVPIQVSRNYV